MNTRRYPQNFIPGLSTQPSTARESENEFRSGSPIDHTTLNGSTTTEKLFLKAGLLGLLIPTPSIHDIRAEQIVNNAEYHKQLKRRLIKSHTIDLHESAVTTQLEKRRATINHVGVHNESDDKENTFGKIQRRNTSDNVKANTGDDICREPNTDISRGKNDHFCRDTNNGACTNTGDDSSQSGASHSFLTVPHNDAETNFLSSTSLLQLDGTSDAHCGYPANVTPTADKRRSRSFSGYISYKSADNFKTNKKKDSFDWHDKRKKKVKNEERETLNALQSALRSKLPKTFQATASMGLFDPTVFNDAKHDLPQPKKQRASLLQWQKNCIKQNNSVKSDNVNTASYLLSKLASSTLIRHKSQQQKEVEAKQRNIESKNVSDKSASQQEHLKSFFSRKISYMKNHRRQEENKQKNNKNNNNKSYFYFSRHNSNMFSKKLNEHPKSTVEHPKSTEIDRNSTYSIDSGINNSESSEEESTKAGDVLHKSLPKTVYLTPTEQQKEAANIPAKSARRKVSITKSASANNNFPDCVNVRRTQRKISTGLRKISIGKPPDVQRGSFKIGKKVGLVKFAPKNERTLIRFNSLPQRPHSYLREISKDFDIRKAYQSSTLPRSINKRPDHIFEEEMAKLDEIIYEET